MARRVLAAVGFAVATFDARGAVLDHDEAWSRLLGGPGRVPPLEPEFFDATRGGEQAAHQRRRVTLAPIHRGDELVIAEFVAFGADDDRVLVAARELPSGAADELVRGYLAAFVGTIDAAVVGTRLDGTIVFWNDAAASIYGYEANEAIGRSIAMVVRQERLFVVDEVLAAARRGEVIDRVPVMNVRKTGELVNVQFSMSPTRDAAGEISGCVFIGRDVTALRDADRLARIYIGAIEHAPNGLALFRSNIEGDEFRLIAANKVGRRMARIDDADLGETSARLAARFSPFARLPDRYDELPFESERLNLGRHTVREADGRERTVEAWAFALPDLVLAFGFNDVTRATAIERERALLLDRVANAEDAERRRLAEALHDDTIQVLSAANMELGGLRRRAGDPDLVRRAERVETSLRHASQSLRSLVFELYPPDLESGGLAAGLRALARRMFDDGTDVEVVDELERRLGSEIRITAYRILQEAMANVRRHARARHVVVRLVEEADVLVATVEDDGVGPGDELPARPGHFGVTTMRERAESRNGSLAIFPRTPNGTTVRLVLPDAFMAVEVPEPQEQPHGR